jgi:lipopolysaccharide transport system permease protein
MDSFVKDSPINQEEEWTLEIKPKSGLLELHLNEVWRYRDLLWMFVKRDFTATFKQTILGPLWFIIQPLLTTVMFMLVFTKVARIPTDGVPPAVFYLSGLTIWNYFATCLTKTSTTFTTNAAIFGKVYFPRLVVPLSTVISSLISFGIQLGLLLVVMIYYAAKGQAVYPNGYVVLIPFLLLLIALLGLGLGIIVSSLTTKYRDLSLLVGFGVQLAMYATPVIYPLTFLSEKYKTIVALNPLAPLIESFRYALVGSGTFEPTQLVYSIIVTLVVLFIGVILFNRVEKTFMDVV